MTNLNFNKKTLIITLILGLILILIIANQPKVYAGHPFYRIKLLNEAITVLFIRPEVNKLHYNWSLVVNRFNETKFYIDSHNQDTDNMDIRISGLLEQFSGQINKFLFNLSVVDDLGREVADDVWPMIQFLADAERKMSLANIAQVDGLINNLEQSILMSGSYDILIDNINQDIASATPVQLISLNNVIFKLQLSA